jgi:glucoamylase
MIRKLLVLSIFIFSLCASGRMDSQSAPASLDEQIQVMLDRSLPRMMCNLSVGSPGSVIASPQMNNPNYYFHWVRDSAIVARALIQLIPFVQGTSSEPVIREFIGDFARFSEKIQNVNSPYGAGETRFLPDGSMDLSEWPRPQYDGLALRALTLLDYLAQNGQGASLSDTDRMQRVIRKDLDDIAKFYNANGFDLWEYANGFHFFTRMTQLKALETGREYFGKRSSKSWAGAARDLSGQLQSHWHPESGTISWSGPVTDSHGQPININFADYDSSVSLAMVHAAPAGSFDDLDERVWSSLWKQEDYFLKTFPINKGKTFGPAVGRDPYDSYYGGNAFFFLTSAFAEHRFRAAIQLRNTRALPVTAFRKATLEHLLRRPVNESVLRGRSLIELSQAFAAEGDAFLKTMLEAIPPDGMMAEQMSKVDGAPVSAKDLTWSYASLLTAVLQREKWTRSTVDYSRLSLTCPTQLARNLF